jgi:3-oxoacyl-[acyl-carrier-protein] synthase III
MASKIIGTGCYLPEKILSNFDLEKSIDTSDEWIKSRTGIAQRHIAADDEFTSHLGYQAALNALNSAKISQDEIDLVITCTNTPDNTFPSTANKIQGYLGLKNVPSFDLQAICSGFIYGLQVADGMIKSGKYKTILLICADKMSSILDWQDRKTCVLFGDGAGAVILQESESNSGVIDCDIFSDGALYDMLYTDGGVSTTGKSGLLKMAGPEVFKKAVEKMPESVYNILKKNDLTLDDVTYIVPHQANLRIINNMINQFGIDSNKVIVTLDKHANCSAASIPLALAQLQLTRGIKSGDILVFTAFGAGATWGAAIVRW